MKGGFDWSARFLIFYGSEFNASLTYSLLGAFRLFVKHLVFKSKDQRPTVPSRKKASKNDIEILKASFLPPQEQEFVSFSLMGLLFIFFGVVNNISIFVLNEFYDFLLGLIMICIVATKGNVSFVHSNLCIGETSIRYRLFFIGGV